MEMMMMLLMNSLKFMMLLIPVLMSVAYLTLAESKILGYSQNSKGPNVVGIYGILQPLANGLKLFSKEIMIPNHVSLFLYFFSPILALSLSLMIWVMFPLGNTNVMVDMNVGFIFIFAMSSMGVYAMLMSGWSSNSKYAFMSSLSAAAQMISYEVSMGLMTFSVIIITGSLNLTSMMISQSQSINYILPMWPMAFMFFMSCLAETNSAPFDLTEGESELVSGYNVEYSSMSFALFFLAEYSHMMFMSFLFSIMFLGGWSFLFMNSDMLLFLKGFLFMFMFIWMSTSFPSLSYDQLMNLLWKSYLPLSLSFIIISNTIVWIFISLPPKMCL